MEEIILSRAEFLVLLDAVGASAVVGIDTHMLIPQSIEEYRELVETGQQLLAERGLLVLTSEGVRALDRRLVVIAQTVLRPDLAVVSVREQPSVGRQLFLHYQRDNAAVEQTFPAAGQHRLAILPDVDALFERLLVIFPVESNVSTPIVLIDQNVFESVQALANQHDTPGARTMLAQAAVADDLAIGLVTAIAEPVFSGNIALLRCVGEEIVDARNILILQGPTTAWSVGQANPGQPTLQVQAVSADQTRNQLKSLSNELHQ